MAYLKKWRQCHAEVEALAEQSSDDTMDVHDMQFSGDDRVDRRIIDGSRSVDGACAEVDGACAEVDGTCAEVVGACAADSDAEFDVSDAMNSSDSDIETFANDDSLDDMNDMTLGTGLADWATRNACSRKGLNEMLDLLRSHGHRLPKDARTLLHTPRNVQTVDKCGGQYIYIYIMVWNLVYSAIWPNLTFILLTTTSK